MISANCEASSFLGRLVADIIAVVLLRIATTSFLPTASWDAPSADFAYNCSDTLSSLLEAIPGTLARCAHGDRSWQAHLSRSSLTDLSPSIDNTRNESNKDSRDGSKGDWRIEEDESRNGNWKLVKRTNHGVCGRRGNTDTPSRGVGDQDGSETRVDHSHDLGVSGGDWEVGVEVRAGPILNQEGKNDQDRDSQQVVVEHGIPILEVHLLDDLAHAQQITRSEKDVKSHPRVTGVESSHLVSTVGAGAGEGGAGTVGGERVLDIGPGGDDGGEDHEAEGEEGGWGDGAAEPEDLSVCDDDDGQVLEDGVDWDGKELECLGGGVDHADEEEGDWKPWV